MTHTARGLAAALFIALGLFANPAAAQRGPAAPTPTGCTGDGNCGEATLTEQVGR
jgi:hypothetical protein